MGLDMYLKAERYVSGYEHSDDLDQKRFKVLAEIADADGFIDPQSPTCTVTFTVAYWRKANAIHNWFVTNVQNGNDDCGDYEVDRLQLIELRDLCAELLKSRDLLEAGRRLPPTPGFFFGSTHIDDYYWEDLQSTISQINRALSAPAGWDFQYHSSW